MLLRRVGGVTWVLYAGGWTGKPFGVWCWGLCGAVLVGWLWVLIGRGWWGGGGARASETSRRSLQKITSEAVGGRFADSRRVISLKTEGTAVTN
eukprot:scaffold45807_cov56-Phaeocystis_antarctica.AAC.1